MDADGHVYLGVWTNWSRGSAIMGATLTTTQSNGNALIAFTAVFIPFVASRLWKMLCFAIHTCRSRRGGQDAIYHQRQVVLRNSSSPDSGLFSLLQLLWAWRRSSAKTLVHVLPLLILALLFIVAFTLAGGYSSRITSVAGNEVLLKGDGCARVNRFEPPSSGIASHVAVNAWFAAKWEDAANYAQQCYAGQGGTMFDCNRFAVSHLPTETADGNYKCPFDSDVCLLNAANLRLDTGYIDSNDHLGLNAPANQRILTRRVLTCAPLKTEGYTYMHTSDNQTFVRYNYGSGYNVGSLVNYTHSVPDLKTQHTQKESGASLGGFNYRMRSQGASMYKGAIFLGNSRFIPVSSLKRTDGDLIIVFLSGNGVFFAEESTDAWYRATRAYTKLGTSKISASLPLYIFDEAASPLGCVQQLQWCNPEYPIPEGCGPLASSLDALEGAFPLFNITMGDWTSDESLAANNGLSSDTERGSRLLWPFLVDSTTTTGVDEFLASWGAKALASQTMLKSGVQLSLSENQWQVDVAKWWNTTLAFHQAIFVNTALGNASTDASLQPKLVPPANDHERLLCQTQKIRHAGYASFNLFGLLFTYILGALIVLMSFLLAPLMRCLHERRSYRQYQYLEWTMNGAMQLHHQAQDELGYGHWTGCTDPVPVTRPGDVLADLDVSDLEYPKLRRDAVEEDVEVEHVEGWLKCSKTVTWSESQMAKPARSFTTLS